MLRIALSPTKDMDLEDLRIALLNYIISKKIDEELVIRIDDANKNKNIEGKDKEILELLNLFSIEHSRIIYQSENIKYHQKLAMQLMTQKKAFSCFCSDTKLDELKKSAKEEGKSYNYDDFCANLSNEIVLEVNAAFTVRIKRPIDNIKLIDSLNGEFNYTPNDIDSFIILNHDKTPTAEYACAVDDMIFNITTVINKKEDILSAPRHIHIRNSLGYEKEINYIHLPTIQNKNIGKKNSLSSIKCLIEEGFLPVAIANYLVLLGNNAPKEIFTLEEAVQWFEIKNISKEEVVFDFEKLKTINKKHLELIDDLRLSKLLGFADADIGKLGKLFLTNASTLNEIKEKLNLIFSKKDLCKNFEDESKQIIKCLKEAPHIEEFNDFKIYITQNTGLEDDSLLKPLRYLLTKEKDGVNLSDIYPYIKNYLGEIIK